MFAKRTSAVLVALVLVLVAAPAVFADQPDPGYNYTAKRYDGPFDGIDGVLDGLYFGEVSEYTDWEISMKWSKILDKDGAPTGEDGWVQDHYSSPDGDTRVFIKQECTSGGCVSTHIVINDKETGQHGVVKP